MTTRPVLFALLPLCLLLPAARAQTPAPAPPAQPVAAAAPVVTVSVTASGVRFAALGPVRQTRLEVYDAAGGRLFDSDFLPGNVRDWRPAAGGAADGAYQCVVSARDLSGRISTKQASVLVAGGVASLWLGEAEAAGGVTSPATEAEGPGAATLTTHDGSVGAVTATAGDLTLRTGDVLAGRDEERVRVTADGRVGVGTDKPEAALDVAGEVRARDGFRFADGSRLAVDEKGALARTSADWQPLPALGAAVSSATANRLAKFSDSSGTLTDSGVTETNGNVGIGTASPASPLTVFSTTNVSPLAIEGAHPIVIGFAVENAAPGSKRWAFQVAGPSHPQGVAAGSFIFRQGTDDLNPLVIAPGGSVGVGTISPQARLDVAGNVNFTGLRTEANATSPNVGGGFAGNTTTAVVGATIAGGGQAGSLNRVRGNFGTVGGGTNNQAGDNPADPSNSEFATVGGGVLNVASGEAATVGGGASNRATGFGATVGGGDANDADGSRATVPGGSQNEANGDSSFAAGLRAKAVHHGAFVWADSTNADFASTGTDQFLIRAAGGVGIGTAQPQAALHVRRLTTDPASPVAAVESLGSQAPLAFRLAAVGVGGFFEAARVRADNLGNLVFATLGGTSKDIFFRAGADDAASTRMLIDGASGHVGVGTTAPTAKLTIAGVGDFLDPAPPRLDLVNTTGGGATYSLHVNNAGAWQLASGTTTRLLVNPAGDLGVGTTAPGARLHVRGGSVAVETQGHGLILRATDGTKCFRVTVNNAGALSTSEVTCP